MKVHTMAQYSPEWWAVRRGLATASDFNRIITPAKGEFASAHKTYIAELIGDELDPSYGQFDDYATAAMKRGTALEPEARSLYKLWAGEAVQQIGIIVSDCGRFGSSADGLVGADGVLELKAPNPATHAAYVIAGVLPPDYKPQCHGHLLVTGRSWCDFVSYLPNQELFIIRVVRDDFTEKLRKCLVLFDAEYQAARKKFGLSYTTEPCSFAAAPAAEVAA